MNTKISLTLSILLFSSLAAFSQITVGDYEKQIEANLNDLPSKESIEVNSTCGAVTIEVEDKVFSGGCAGTLVREYSYSDDCGNTATAMQFIKLIDTTAPQFINAEPVVYAGANGENAPTELETNDNSGFKSELSFSDKTKKDHIIRTWKAVDACGNESSFEQKLMLTEEM